MLAGHVVEKMVFGEVSNMHGKDLENATKLARDMVFNLGMGTLDVTPFGEAAPFKDFSREDLVSGVLVGLDDNPYARRAAAAKKR